MRGHAALWIYRLMLPLLFVAAFPGWLLKMLRRGGFGTRLGERLAIYTEPPDFEPCQVVHLHAVSVGESLLALKLIRAWLAREPDRRFVLATGTATGHQVATGAAIPEIRVTYSPLDFPSMVRRYLDRFEPARIVLIEGEAWPNLLDECRSRNIPVSLVNARMSPRSSRRYRKFAPLVRPVFSSLDAVAIQEPEDASIWRDLGVETTRIHLTGSLKFDPGAGANPVRRTEFQQLLDGFGHNRPVILAASTHPGEEAWIAAAIHQAAPNALPVIAPRHAERRQEVIADLERAGFDVILRSAFRTPKDRESAHVLVIDSTGELRDWTAHTHAVIIGKSFLSTGGQNPAEAILAGKPVICGPHMENFEPLAGRLTECGGCLRARTRDELKSAIERVLDPRFATTMTISASRLLSPHEGAAQRMIDLLTHHSPMPK